MKFDKIIAVSALFLILSQYSGFAQGDETFLILPTTRSGWLSDRLLAGCLTAANQLRGVSCKIANPVTPSETVSEVENFIANKGSGIILQTYGSTDDQVIATALRTARNAGIPSVVVSSSLIEAASVYKDVAVSIVGISDTTFVQKVVQAASELGAKDARFCILAFDNDWSALHVRDPLVNELRKLGATPAANCPSALKYGAPFEETLTSTVREILAVQSVTFFVLPFMNLTKELGDLQQVALQAGQKTVFLSIWPSPFDSARAATTLLYKAIPGESVPSVVQVPPIIQISTTQYCDKCDCDKDTNCKEACPKCNK